MSKQASPDLPELLGRLLGLERGDIHTAMPGRVESYDSARQRCVVQPLIQRGYIDGAGSRQVKRRSAITEVPVVWLGGGGTSITAPIAPGDVVLLVISESSLDAWLAGDGSEVDPQDDRRHALTDAIAIPVMRATPLPDGATATDAIVIDGGGARIEVDASVAALGGRAGAQKTIKGEDFVGAALPASGMIGFLTAFKVWAIGLAPVDGSSPPGTATGTFAGPAPGNAIDNLILALDGFLTDIARVK